MLSASSTSTYLNPKPLCILTLAIVATVMVLADARRAYADDCLCKGHITNNGKGYWYFWDREKELAQMIEPGARKEFCIVDQVRVPRVQNNIWFMVLNCDESIFTGKSTWIPACDTWELKEGNAQVNFGLTHPGFCHVNSYTSDVSGSDSPSDKYVTLNKRPDGTHKDGEIIIIYP